MHSSFRASPLCDCIDGGTGDSEALGRAYHG